MVDGPAYQSVFAEFEKEPASISLEASVQGKSLTRGDQIRILSYNIWFERTNQQDRLDALVQVILDSDADFVCLQEVIESTR